MMKRSSKIVRRPRTDQVSLTGGFARTASRASLMPTCARSSACRSGSNASRGHLVEARPRTARHLGQPAAHEIAQPAVEFVDAIGDALFAALEPPALIC